MQEVLYYNAGCMWCVSICHKYIEVHFRNLASMWSLCELWCIPDGNEIGQFGGLQENSPF